MSLRRNPTAAAVTLLVVAGAALYATNLTNPLFWDDNELIVTNPHVHALTWPNVATMFSQDLHGGSGLRTNYYRPLLLLSFALNYAVAGPEPEGYHWVSNGLHVANSVLVFLLLSQAAGPLGAILAAALFLIHPLQTEAVTYVAGRGDPLHLFFSLLALGAFRRAERGGAHSRLSRALSLALLLLALLSHERAIVFPFLVVVFSAVFVLEGGWVVRLRRSVLAASPYFAVVFVYGVCRLTFLDFAGTLDFHTVPTVYSEQLHVRLFTFLHVLLVYYRLLVLPTGLHMERDLASHGSFFDLPVWTSFVALIALVAALALARRREAGRVWIFGAGWFFATLLPVSGITPINSVIYEHWLYVGLIGPAAATGWTVARAWAALAARPSLSARIALAAVLVAYGSFLAVQTVRRNLLWGQPVAFLEEILRYEPDSISAHNNLGNEYYDRGDLDRAELHYQAATAGPARSAHPHFNLGLIYEERGQPERAIAQYERALEIDPDFYFAMQKLIEVRSRRGEFDQVLRWIEPLKRLRPRDPHVYYNAARAFEYLGQHERALADARTALALATRYADGEVAERVRRLVAELER